MSSRGTRKKPDAFYRRRGPAPTRFPPRSRAPSRASVRNTLSKLAIAKTAEYVRRKKEVIDFTEKVMKRRIKGMVRKHIESNHDTVMDFITQLNFHPSVQSAFIVEELPNPDLGGFRCVVDVKLPKTALPTDTRNPLPPEIVSQLRDEIVNNIMQYAEPSTPSSNRRIIVDIYFNHLFKVINISMPSHVYFGRSSEYYSTVEGDRTGLGNIRLMEMGLKDDVILAILENLNGKNYCNTIAFKNICRKIRADLNQPIEELRQWVVFPEEREFGPELENTDPIIEGRIVKKINIVKMLPILLSGLHRYCDHHIGVEDTPSETRAALKELVAKLDKITKGAPKANHESESRVKYKAQKMLRIGVTIGSLKRGLLNSLANSDRIGSLFDHYLTSEHAADVYKFISDGPGRNLLEVNALNNNNGPHVVKILLREFTSTSGEHRRGIDTHRIDTLERERDFAYVTLIFRIPKIHALPTSIPPSPVVNYFDIDSNRLPPNVVTADVIEDASGIKSRKKTKKPVKHGKYTKSKNKKKKKK